VYPPHTPYGMPLLWGSCYAPMPLQRIAVMLASCLALLTYHLIVGAFSLLFGTRVRLLMHPWPHPVQYQRNTLYRYVHIPLKGLLDQSYMH
jgi:hypothetical protein